MGLFREAGRQVEQFKQKVTDDEDAEAASDTSDGEGTTADQGTEASDDTDTPNSTQSGDTEASENNYECGSCGEQFATPQAECPECWSDAVSPTSET